MAKMRVPMPGASDVTGEFTPTPAGTHAAVCCDFVELGEVSREWQGKVSTFQACQFAFQTLKTMDNGKPYLVTSQKFRMSLHPKGNLSKFVSAWLGRPLAPGEEFDPEEMVGKGALLNVVHVERPRNDGNGTITFANIGSVMPLMEGMQAPVIRDYTRRKDREVVPAPHTDDDVAFPVDEDGVPLF